MQSPVRSGSPGLEGRDNGNFAPSNASHASQHSFDDEETLLLDPQVRPPPLPLPLPGKCSYEGVHPSTLM